MQHRFDRLAIASIVCDGPLVARARRRVVAPVLSSDERDSRSVSDFTVVMPPHLLTCAPHQRMRMVPNDLLTAPTGADLISSNPGRGSLRGGDPKGRSRKGMDLAAPEPPFSLLLAQGCSLGTESAVGRARQRSTKTQLVSLAL